MIRLGALGDVLRTLPAVHALRALYPRSELAWLVEPAAAGAVDASTAVDRTIVFPRQAFVESLRALAPGRLASLVRGVAGVLREPGFDLVLDFHGILKSGVLAKISGARCRVGYSRPFAREGAWWFATHRANLGRDRISRYARNGGLVELLGGSLDALPGDAIALDEAAVAYIDAALGERRRPIVLHPGSSPATPYKRYPPAQLGAVARALARAGAGDCVVAHGPGEKALAQAVVAASEGFASLAPDTPHFAELAALHARARLFVGPDSGPLHLSSLLGVPVVQLLGPTHPVENTPYTGAPWRRVREPIACSPCRRGCAAATCMSAIEPAVVVDAALELVAAQAPARASGAPLTASMTVGA